MRYLLIVALVAVGGCATSEGPSCGGTAPVHGTWDYAGTRTTLPGSDLTGTLTVSSVTGCQFSGTLEIVETPSSSPSFSYAGTIFGTAVNDSVVDFDAQFPEHPVRTHIGVVHGDSVAGDWIEGTGTSAIRGTFRAHRTAP